ncbi:hypothetical protein EWI61_01435 [Methylolobus aquaticus]|nr:hypothetical protein EWI61_01435 [Methylolobus aquaticus]
MRVLHIVAQASQVDPPLARCLASLNCGDALLLIDGAADVARRGHADAARLEALPADVAVCVLVGSASAAGQTGSELIPRATLVDFAGFVDLTVVCDTSVTWC